MYTLSVKCIPVLTLLLRGGEAAVLTGILYTENFRLPDEFFHFGYQHFLYLSLQYGSFSILCHLATARNIEYTDFIRNLDRKWPIQYQNKNTNLLSEHDIHSWRHLHRLHC